MSNASDAIGSTPPGTTTVHIIYKTSLKNRAQIIEDEMMDDAIAKISGENLPFDGIKGYEADTFRDAVCFGENVFMER